MTDACLQRVVICAASVQSAMSQPVAGGSDDATFSLHSSNVRGN